MKIISFYLIILTVIGLFTGCSSDKTSEDNIDVEVIQKGSIERTVEAVGVITPTYTVEVKSKASGEILSMPFEEGEWVEKGDLLLQLDPVDEQRNLRRQQAQLKNVIANLNQSRITHEKLKLSLELKHIEIESKEKRSRSEFNVAKSNYKRINELHSKQLNPDQSLEEALNRRNGAEASLELILNEKSTLKLNEFDIKSSLENIKVQEARFEQEEVNLEIARLRLDETKILSPIKGLILKRMVEPGQIISSGISNVSGGTTLMLLADVKKMYLDTQVDESDISSIKLGQPVELRIEAWPRRKFTGTVERIAPQGEEISNVTIFRVRIALGDKASRLVKPGMNATARIVYEQSKDILKVPLQALTRQDESFGVTLQTTSSSAKTSKFVPVKVGIRDAKFAEISGPVKAGQLVIIQKSNFNSGSSSKRDMQRGMRIMGRARRGR